MLESEFKRQTKERIKDWFSYLDLDFIDGKAIARSLPDLFILGPRYWAALEFKQSEFAPHQPNQDYHIERLSKKGYARFVYPENLKEVFDELERLFTS